MTLIAYTTPFLNPLIMICWNSEKSLMLIFHFLTIAVVAFF